MPSLLTHSFFGEDFLSRHESESNFLLTNKDAFLIGSQGPDPLFFYGIWPKRVLHPLVALAQVGIKIHKSDGQVFFSSCFQQLDKMLIPYSKDVFSAFVFGEFAHYILDSTCHPYVYYWSGFDAKSGRVKGKYHYRHAHFEGRIDSELALQRAQLQLIKKPQKVLSVDEEKLALISENVCPALEKIRGKKVPCFMYRDSVLNMNEVYSMVNGARRKGKAIMRVTPLYKLYIPRDPNGDVLNNGHQTWQNPFTGEKRKESFDELLVIAGKRLEKAYQDFKDNGFTYEVLKKHLTGSDYNGGFKGRVKKYKDEKDFLYREEKRKGR